MFLLRTRGARFKKGFGSVGFSRVMIFCTCVSLHGGAVVSVTDTSWISTSHSDKSNVVALPREPVWLKNMQFLIFENFSLFNSII